MIDTAFATRFAPAPLAEVDYLCTVNGPGAHQPAIEWVAGAWLTEPTDNTLARATTATTMRRRIE